MKLLNKKGMTLFELLAVIIILGIVAAIAFPTVNRLIDNQRKDAFAEEANMFVSNAVILAEDEFEFLEDDQGNPISSFSYFLNSEDDNDYDENFDITDEFPKLSSDYSGKITFNVSDGKLSITEITFENDKFKITDSSIELTHRFDRNDVNKK